MELLCVLELARNLDDGLGADLGPRLPSAGVIVATGKPCIASPGPSCTKLIDTDVSPRATALIGPVPERVHHSACTEHMMLSVPPACACAVPQSTTQAPNTPRTRAI
jgi:hypothetical protein